MRSTEVSVPVQVRPAASVELPEVAALVASTLPELSFTGVPSWEVLRGSGAHYWENLLLVAVLDGSVVGAALAAPALLQDRGVDVPWWCLDFVAVEREYRKAGVGRLLIERVRETASLAGVACLYGLCKAELRPWYEGLGFGTTGPSAVLESDVAMLPDRNLTMSTDDGNCWFLQSLSDGPQLRMPNGDLAVSWSRRVPA